LTRAYLYTLIAVFTWGASLPVNKAIVMAEGGGQRLTPTQVALWCIAVGWLALLIVLAARRRLGRLGESRSLVGASAALAAALPPLAYLSPVLALAVGWVVLREGFGPGFWQGTMLIAAGNAVNLMTSRRRVA